MPAERNGSARWEHPAVVPHLRAWVFQLALLEAAHMSRSLIACGSSAISFSDIPAILSLSYHQYRVNLHSASHYEGQSTGRPYPSTLNVWGSNYVHFVISFSLSAIQILIIDCRGTPSRLASLSKL